MIQILIIAALLLAPVSLMYGAYQRYFQVKPRFSERLTHFALGGVVACLILLAAPWFLLSFKSTSFVSRAFVEAALLEKAGTFIVLLFYVVKKKEDLSIIDATLTGMLLGLGFSAVENIFYSSLSINAILFIRLISSVPLHVFTCGIMGYFIGAGALYGHRGKKAVYISLAFLFPVTCHGMYDYFFLKGGSLPYLNAALLLFLGFFMEYLLARGRNIPSRETFSMAGLSFEEWESVQRDPQYERWILQSMGSEKIKGESFFMIRFDLVKFVGIILLTAFAVTAFLEQENLMSYLSFSLSTVEIVMLFVLLPSLYGFMLFMVNIINPRYFQESIIKIPVITDLTYYVDGKQEVQITYDITPYSCFIKTIEPLEKGSIIHLILDCAGIQSPKLSAEVAWNYHDIESHQNGTLVRFTDIPAGFYTFYIRYYIYKVLKGIYFNLKLPGATRVRRLFVRPESILQKEYHYEEGTVLFHQGDRGRDIYLVRKGKVDIIKKGEKGEEIILTTLAEGDIFGEMAIAGNQPRMAEARCRTDCIMARGEGDNLDVLIEQNPEFTQRLINNFARRLFDSEAKMLKTLKKVESRADERTEIMAESFLALLSLKNNRDAAEQTLSKEETAFLLKKLKERPLSEDLYDFLKKKFYYLQKKTKK